MKAKSECISALRTTIETVTQYDPITLNESQVRQYIVDPIIEALGWETRVPSSVLVEAAIPVPSGIKHADYILSDGGNAIATVEVKRGDIDLAPPTSRDLPKVLQEWYIQACFYSFLVGTPMTILTNGREWLFLESFAVGQFYASRHCRFFPNLQALLEDAHAQKSFLLDKDNFQCRFPFGEDETGHVELSPLKGRYCYLNYDGIRRMVVWRAEDQYDPAAGLRERIHFDIDFLISLLRNQGRLFDNVSTAAVTPVPSDAAFKQNFFLGQAECLLTDEDQKHLLFTVKSVNSMKVLMAMSKRKTTIALEDHMFTESISHFSIFLRGGAIRMNIFGEVWGNVQPRIWDAYLRPHAVAMCSVSGVIPEVNLL